ncbi:MAG: DEAD/DEAH box helicase, partial [Planctomycetota bacterium]
AAYIEAERVELTRVTADHIFAVVRDGVEYQTQLSRDDGNLKTYCTCDQFQKFNVCKHLWASILAVDQAGYLTGAVKPGYIPPFIVESAPLSFDENDPDFDFSMPADFELGGPRSRKTKSGGSQSTAVSPKPRLREWEARLVQLKNEFVLTPVLSKTTQQEREIFYEIDVEESRESGQLVVQTSQRQRRATGQWGKLKPLKLKAGQLQEVEHEDDRRILAYLSGGTPERTNWRAQQTETQIAAFRYRIPFELCELILPLMCGTGHVRYLDRQPDDVDSLAWDGEHSWEFCMGVERNRKASSWKLSGHLKRGDDVLEISSARLIVAGGLVLTRNKITPLEDYEAFPWIKMIQLDETIEVEDGEQQELVDRLLDMPVLPRLELPAELHLEEITCDPKPELLIHSPQKKRWQQDRLYGEVHFNYLDHLVSGSSTQWAIVDREEKRCILRNREKESKAWTLLQDSGFRRLLDRRIQGRDVEISARDLGNAVRDLIKEGWAVRADGKQVHQPSNMLFKVQSGIDWFELHADIDFEGQTVLFPELLSALARGDSSIRLDDGSLGILPEEWIEQYGILAGIAVTDDDHLRFAPNQVALLDALLNAQEFVETDAVFDEFRDKIRSFSGISIDKEPEGFFGELRKYQLEGLGWLQFLQDFHFGGCLADDMGLGKTVQLLALLLRRKQSREEHLPSLAIVPKSLMFNWIQEAAKFTPSLRTVEYAGGDRSKLIEQLTEYDLVLTTYGTMRRDINQIKDIQFDYAVLDEAQMIKNSGSQVAKASRLLKAKHRLALSGTPVENHLGDLWSIFEFLNPGMLGRSSVFKAYTSDIEDKNSRVMLGNALRPFILRRTKEQVANELPEKVEQTLYCDMGKEQTRLYDELRQHYRDSILGMVETKGLGKTKIHVLEALLRLRQAACHPALLERGRALDASAKMDVLIPHLEELIEEGHKALVFSQFTSMLSIVQEHLDQKNIVYEYLDGQTRDRKERVERFQTDKDCGIFLISLKAGGLGLNLTAADYVFILDPWWNPAVETQAIDRAHRVGQTKRVFAYKLICRNTVEEKITELQQQKRELADAILEENQSVLKNLSSEDLELLLS